MCGSPTVPVLHQNPLLTSNKMLQGSPGSRLRQPLLHPGLIGMFLPPQMSQNWHTQKKSSAWFSRCKRRLVIPTFCLITTLSYCFFPPSSSGTVPTVPPGNVQAEAVNSTTVRFTWSAPSPQFINGINQGYKVSGPFLSTGALWWSEVDQHAVGTMSLHYESDCFPLILQVGCLKCKC